MSTDLPTGSSSTSRQPKRLCHIRQPTPYPLLPVRSTPNLHSHPHLTSSSSSPSPPTRPGAPKRSHSFCGDLSASTYALASVSGNHLCPEKKILVAPPLERTLSSIGVRGNHSPPHQQMARPHFLPLLDPTKPLPNISVSPPSHMARRSPRPIIAPIQRSSPAPLSSSISSRSSSYILATPTATSVQTYGLPYLREEKDYGTVDEDSEMVGTDDVTSRLENIVV